MTLLLHLLCDCDWTISGERNLFSHNQFNLCRILPPELNWESSIWCRKWAFLASWLVLLWVSSHLVVECWQYYLLMCVLCLQIPNPLFDLAGITCGHFLVPFWTFFGATLIGKAIIKMHIQVGIVSVLDQSCLRESGFYYDSSDASSDHDSLSISRPRQQKGAHGWLVHFKQLRACGRAAIRPKA